jgi:4-hydroxyphenylpyruvate dioxygenase
MYGDGVKDVAFTVFDAEKAYEKAIKNGADPAYEPRTYRDEHGTVTMAGIKTYGRVHPHVRLAAPARTTSPRSSKAGSSCPASSKRRFDRRRGDAVRPAAGHSSVLAINEYNRKHPCGLKYVDHLVGNVELGKMNYWVKWYEDVLEFKMFKHFDDKDISTEYSALMSKVMASGNNLIKMPINEPAPGKKKSQVQEYLDWHCNTPGVQHLALRTDDELHSIAALRARGVDFLTLPDAYYDKVWDRVDTMLTEHGHQAVREDHDASATSASWSTPTTRATCCSSSPSRCRTGRRCSSRSSAAAAARASARGTSRRCSRRWSWSRSGGGICKSQPAHLSCSSSYSNACQTGTY